MPPVIEIGVPIEEIEARKERITRTKRFETPDRIPVVPAIAHRFLVPKLGVRFRDYYSDPETMLRTQILAQKWLFENVRTDAYSITGPWVGAWTDFQNTFEAGSLGCEIFWPDDDIPWIGHGWVCDDSDLEKLESIDYIHTGINARQIEFRRRMMEVASKYPVRFQGGPVFYPGAGPSLTHTADGPFGVAASVMGQTEAFLACYERPEFLHEVLRIITDRMIEYLDFCWAEEGLTDRDFAWTDDLAANLSEEHFREFALPYNQRLRSHFDGWLMLHMCGKTDHLLKMFVDELKIHEFQGYGYQVDLDKVGQLMGGKVVLTGNVSPMLVHSGTPDEVCEATRRVIEKLGHFKGVIIQDGNNIPPGTPLENINAMTQAAEIYGRYE